MNKKVLVIPEDDNKLNDMIEKIWDAVNQGTAAEVMRKFALPGPLLAEFEQRASFKRQINDKRDLCVVFPESAEIKKGQPIHVLILHVPTEEGEENGS